VANHFRRDERDDLADAKKAREQGSAKQQLEELKQAGSIVREAAIVFSREGMELFANIFGNTMERVVSQAIDDRVSAIIDQKMIEMMDGMKIGMQQGMSSMAENMFKGLTPSTKKEEKQIEFDLETLKATPVVDTTPPEVTNVQATVELPETAPTSVVYNNKGQYPTNQEVVEKLNTLLNEADKNVKLEVVKPEIKAPRKYVGCKIAELKHWAPIFAEYVQQRSPRKVSLKEIVDAICMTYNVKFTNASHITNTMVELFPEITKPEKGFYVYNKK
jgi:hypothetical protein